MAQPIDDSSSELIAKVTTYVEQYMSQYDGSHDFSHVQRVLALSQQILITTTATGNHTATAPAAPAYDTVVVTLSALLHDVGDKKYLKPGESGNTLARDVLRGFGAPAELATKVQAIVSAVSYSTEMSEPGAVRRALEAHPELAIVQDADRLDALGAVGIGRAFTYGGAVGGGGARADGAVAARPMAETVQHFAAKLERLEGLMKTDVGRALARERTRRLTVFKGWWEEEVSWAGGV